MMGVDGPRKLIIVTGWELGQDRPLKILGSTTNDFLASDSLLFYHTEVLLLVFL